MSDRNPTLLGYPAGSRLVMYTCDEFGETQASNAGVIAAMEAGLGIRPYTVGATVQMPGAWVPQALAYAREHPQADIGVHLTVETHFPAMKMRPLCSRREVPGLYSPQGYFWGTAQEAWAHAPEDEMYRELRTQIETALGAGLDVTHLDGHGSFPLVNPAGYCRIVGQLAGEFRLPMRNDPRPRYERLGLTEHRDALRDRGIVMCDDDTSQGLRRRQEGESWRAFFLRRLGEIGPGLTDFYIHPSIDTPELRSMLGDDVAAGRAEQYRLLVDDVDFRDAVAASDVRVVTWREVREYQRERM